MPVIFQPNREKLTTSIRTQGGETKYFPITIDMHQEGGLGATVKLLSHD